MDPIKSLALADVSYRYWHPVPGVWNTNPVGATLQLSREKVYSFSLYNVNTLQGPAPGQPGQWRDLTPQEVAALSPVEQGQFYHVYPQEEQNGETRYRLILTRLGDKALLALGVPRSIALMTDEELLLSEQEWLTIQRRGTNAGACFVVEMVNFAALEQIVAQGQVSIQALEELLAEAQDRIPKSGAPDQAVLADLDILHQQARREATGYEALRRQALALIGQLQGEPGRSAEKAQALAWRQGLPETSVPLRLAVLKKQAISQAATALQPPGTSQASGTFQTSAKLQALYAAAVLVYERTPVTVRLDSVRDAVVLTYGRREILLFADRVGAS